jgi:hypothetical protein
MRVLELATLFPGPLAGRFLLSLGFKVVKVEPPGGDPMRGLSPTLYRALNEGKHVVYLDLQKESKSIYEMFRGRSPHHLQALYRGEIRHLLQKAGRGEARPHLRGHSGVWRR